MTLLELVLFGAGMPLAVLLCLRLAPRLGLVDRPDEAPERKHQASPVPAVGGLALVLVGVVGWLVLRLLPESYAHGGLELLEQPGLALSLGLAFLLGALDDVLPAGLSPLQKVGGQFLAAAPLAWLVPGAEGLLLVLAGVAAMNVVNTFDNSDGCLTALSAAALAPVSAGLALALATFLPFNLGRLEPLRDGQAPGERGRRPPMAYLGDGGSHLLGIVLLFHPGTWLVLLLPGLDLARVSLVRMRAGERPWEGDRRHLAHRFEDLGWPPWRIAALQVVIAAPTIFVGTSGAWEYPLAFFLAVCLTGAMFAGALAWSRSKAA